MAPRQIKGQSKRDQNKAASSENSTATVDKSRSKTKSKAVSVTSSNSRPRHHRRAKEAYDAETESETHDVESKPDKTAEKENVVPDFPIKGKYEVKMFPPVTPAGLNSANLVHRLHRHTTGQLYKHSFRQATVQPYAQQLSEFRVSQALSPFNRRVTALEWHPTHPTMLAVGSKGGDLMLWDYSKGQDGGSIIQGIGPGGNIACLHISRDNASQVYSASLDGQVRLQSFEGKVLHIFKNTMDWSFWYCSVDINYTDDVLVAGDNVGNVVLMSRAGEQLWSHRLHKQKVTHCEFNKQCPWLLTTASTDKTVKIWDIRSLAGRKSAIYQMPHDRPINSAYFSPDGTKLLTTDQNHELRIYTGPLWDRLERTIVHPHRFFQHLTPIKATWHPYQNLIVVGRYPDESLAGFEHDTVRSVDTYDVSTGELVCRLMDQCAPGIQSLNVFSPNGDALATGMGLNTLIWQNADIRAQEREEQREVMRRMGREPPPDDGPSKKPPKRHRSKDQKLQKLLPNPKRKLLQK